MELIHELNYVDRSILLLNKSVPDLDCLSAVPNPNSSVIIQSSLWLSPFMGPSAPLHAFLSRFDGVPPPVAGLVDIGVTDPSRVDVDTDFVRTGSRCSKDHGVGSPVALCTAYVFVSIIVSSLGI